jgi:hypothetical protein
MRVHMSGAHDLATRAQEMGAAVLRGRLEHDGSGGWTVDGQPLAGWLAELVGQQIYLIAIATDARSGSLAVKRTCRTCGRDYEGAECPYCREARIRLRGQ